VAEASVRRSLHPFIKHRLHCRGDEMRRLEIVECDANGGEPNGLADPVMLLLLCRGSTATHRTPRSRYPISIAKPITNLLDLD
jgi:hypothetical protein